MRGSHHERVQFKTCYSFWSLYSPSINSQSHTGHRTAERDRSVATSMCADVCVHGKRMQSLMEHSCHDLNVNGIIQSQHAQQLSTSRDHANTLQLPHVRLTSCNRNSLQTQPLTRTIHDHANRIVKHSHGKHAHSEHLQSHQTYVCPNCCSFDNIPFQ